MTRAAGLCAICRWVCGVETARGTTYLRCRRSETDADYPKYPRLPMEHCPGFEPQEPNQDAPPD